MAFYYNDPNFLNVSHAIDLIMIEHLADMIFGGDQSRIIYASNAYAFRKRINSNKKDSNLNLPFINFRLKDYNNGDPKKWHIRGYTKGSYIPEIEAKVKFSPIQMTYEASAWFATDFDNKYAFNILNLDAHNKTMLKPHVVIDTKDIYFHASLGYDNLSFDPQYDENDWLKQNKIHSLVLDFSFDTFLLTTNRDITIPTELITKFAMSHDLTGNTYEETYTAVINHLTEEVELEGIS